MMHEILYVTKEQMRHDDETTATQVVTILEQYRCKASKSTQHESRFDPFQLLRYTCLAYYNTNMCIN